MKPCTRRSFIRATGMLTVAGCGTEGLFGESASVAAGLRLPQLGPAPPKFQLGMASYTFRAFGLDPTLAMTRRLNLKRICFKDFHLPMEAGAGEIREAVEKVKAAGLQLYGCGVVYMRTEAETRRAFGYATLAGMEIIIGVPNHELLPLVDQLVREYDLRFAIHNHGPADKLYPTPESVYERIRMLDPRVGLCLDVGHTVRAGIDPAAAAIRFADRLLDVHIKDVTAASEKGTTCEMGRGVVDVPAFLRALLGTGYAATVSLEYEKDEKDPLPGVAESIGFVRGVLAGL